MAETNSFETVTVTGTAIGITAALITNATKSAFLTLETAQIRYRTDGTNPSATVGHLLEVGETLKLTSIDEMNKFRAIRTGATSGVLRVSVERE